MGRKNFRHKILFLNYECPIFYGKFCRFFESLEEVKRILNCI